MHVMIGLSIATGLPWEYFAEQDDQIVSTYLDVLKRARSGGAGQGKRAAQMSG